MDDCLSSFCAFEHVPVLCSAAESSTGPPLCNRALLYGMISYLLPVVCVCVYLRTVLVVVWIGLSYCPCALAQCTTNAET